MSATRFPKTMYCCTDGGSWQSRYHLYWTQSGFVFHLKLSYRAKLEGLRLTQHWVSSPYRHVPASPMLCKLEFSAFFFKWLTRVFEDV
jgi:hypothetical protein